MNKRIKYPEKKGGPSNPYGIVIHAWPMNDADPVLDWQWEIDVSPTSFPLEAMEHVIEALRVVQAKINETKAQTEPKKYEHSFTREYENEKEGIPHCEILVELSFEATKDLKIKKFRVVNMDIEADIGYFFTKEKIMEMYEDHIESLALEGP